MEWVTARVRNKSLSVGMSGGRREPHGRRQRGVAGQGGAREVRICSEFS